LAQEYFYNRENTRARTRVREILDRTLHGSRCRQHLWQVVESRQKDIGDLKSDCVSSACQMASSELSKRIRFEPASLLHDESQPQASLQKKSSGENYAFV
jgi:hypothetical protein